MSYLFICMKYFFHSNLKIIISFTLIILSNCNSIENNPTGLIQRKPQVEPDIIGTTVPYNIAPMNFMILEKGTSFLVVATSPDGYQVSVNSSDGIIQFSEKKWKKLLAGSKGKELKLQAYVADKKNNTSKFDSFYIKISNEPIDSYLCYRLLYPGYEKWSKMKISQRNLESFKETSLIENQVIDNNCINCHSFNNYSPDKFLLHQRGSLGGTYFIDKGKITKMDLKTEEMKSGAVYPAWHPDGKLVAFSSNNVVQSFHAINEKNIEVYDLSSALYLYDLTTGAMAEINNDNEGYMDTYPEWSPDGKYLYFCRTKQFKQGGDFKTIRYNLMRQAFDEPSRKFGKPELLLNADSLQKSISFPRVSPDGKFLVYTLHNYGTFSIWHKEADLYLMDLQNKQTHKLNINSDETESWHSWSSNSKWLVFSSKRDDGLTARPYFAYIGSPDEIGKPFILPQKSPSYYKKVFTTFNRPEFVSGKINFDSRDFARAAKSQAIKAK